MSNVTSFYAQPVPVSYTSTSSMWPWIIVIIILIIVIIILAIWLAVRFNSNNGGNNTNLVTIGNAEIKSSSSLITGSWKTLSNDTDKVTLYVSTDPLIFDNKGVAINPTVSPAFTTGPNNSISISAGLTVNTIYNVALVATNANSNNYVIFGPKKVITQEGAQLKNLLINIRDLDNPLGSVSNIGTYTENGQNTGIYRYGDASGSNPKFLVRYNADSEPTDMLLCRHNSVSNTASGTNVVLAEWTNSAEPTETPSITYTRGTTVTTIPVDSCQWTYNDPPSDGTNQWCLYASQPTNTTNSTVSQTLCLSQNGNSLNVVTPASATVWFNQQYGIASLN